MKTYRLFIALLLIAPSFACTSQSSEKKVNVTDSDSEKIEAYYFHFTARCTTCKTIEADARKNLELLYPEKVKAGLISFQSLNLDDAINKPIAEKLGVSGQTLLFVRGDQKINLTNEGFLYAVAKPEKFKEVIREKVDLLSLKK